VRAAGRRGCTLSRLDRPGYRHRLSPSPVLVPLLVSGGAALLVPGAVLDALLAF
jgi:hypothetical protein